MITVPIQTVLGLDFADWHRLWSEGEAPATWVLCGLTAILCIGIFQAAKAARWNKQQLNLQMMIARFNSNDMHFARAMAAKQMRDPKLSNMLGHPPAHARKVIAFLMQADQMLERGELKIDDLVIHLGDHVMMYGEKFTRLGDPLNQGRYASFIALHGKVKNSDRFRQFQDDLDTYFDEEFWECEASLTQ